MGRLKLVLTFAALAFAGLSSWFLFGYLETTQRLVLGWTLFALVALGLGLALHALRLKPGSGGFSTLFTAGLLLSAAALAGYAGFATLGRDFVPVPFGSSWAILHQAHFGYLLVLGLPVLYTTIVQWIGSLLEHELVLVEALAAE